MPNAAPEELFLFEESKRQQGEIEEPAPRQPAAEPEKGSGAPMGDRPPLPAFVPAGGPEQPGGDAPASSSSQAPPSRRATLLLDRPKPPRAPAPPLSSPMDIAGTDPPTTPEVEVAMSDSEMLAEVAERATKHRRVCRVGEEDLAMNDEPMESAPEWEDAEFAMEGETDLLHKADEAALEADAAFWFAEIPDLNEEEMQALDFKPDCFEVERLIRKKVLEYVNEGESTSGVKELSSKFVRSWRQKKKDNKQMFYRRSRLVAREYK